MYFVNTYLWRLRHMYHLNYSNQVYSYRITYNFNELLLGHVGKIYIHLLCHNPSCRLPLTKSTYSCICCLPGPRHDDNLTVWRVKFTVTISKPRTAKRRSEMVFPVDERVIMHYCTGDPLINGESHFTASFGSSWFRNCNCKFYSSNCSNGSYQTNKMEIWVQRTKTAKTTI